MFVCDFFKIFKKKKQVKEETQKYARNRNGGDLLKFNKRNRPYFPEWFKEISYMYKIENILRIFSNGKVQK